MSQILYQNYFDCAESGVDRLHGDGVLEPVRGAYRVDRAR
jgi:hypothetical protein